MTKYTISSSQPDLISIHSLQFSLEFVGKTFYHIELHWFALNWNIAEGGDNRLRSYPVLLFRRPA